MHANLRVAGWRCFCAVSAVLGSAALAWAQYSTARPLPKGHEAEAIAMPAGPVAPAAPAAPVAAPTRPVPEPAAPAVLGPRLTRIRWFPWPKVQTVKLKVEDPCDHCGNVTQTPEELQRVQSGQASLVEMAAAKIKADEAAAPGRRAAIRYLASVKCHYFPEAEAALVAALRADRNECVRLDAAQALAECCCLTPKTMEALLLAVSGSERDGNPAEVSERVKSAANGALQRYAARGMSVPHPDTLPAATQPSTQKPLPKELQLTSFTTLALTAQSATAITDEDRRFAETAGLVTPAGLFIPSSKAAAPTAADRHFAETAGIRPASATSVRYGSALPEIRLRPIGVVPAGTGR